MVVLGCRYQFLACFIRQGRKHHLNFEYKKEGCFFFPSSGWWWGGRVVGDGETNLKFRFLRSIKVKILVS